MCDLLGLAIRKAHPFRPASQKPMSDTANMLQTLALAGGGRSTAVEKLSPWNTPAVQPPPCSTSLMDDQGTVTVHVRTEWGCRSTTFDAHLLACRRPLQ